MNISPKKLSIDEMWNLYKLIGDGVPKQDEKYLVHETIKILDNISTQNFKRAMAVLYGEEFYINKNPVDFAVMFVKALKKSGFIDFVHLLNRMKSGNS